MGWAYDAFDGARQSPRMKEARLAGYQSRSHYALIGCIATHEFPEATVFELECQPPRLSLCECCGATTTQLTRYVHRDPDTVAVYLAVFSDGHPYIDMLFGLGVWGEYGSPAKRTAFAARVQLVENIPNIMLVDRAMSPWDTDFLGRMLDRAEALEHPLKQDVFDLFDFIVFNDAPLNEFLAERRWPS